MRYPLVRDVLVGVPMTLYRSGVSAPGLGGPPTVRTHDIVVGRDKWPTLVALFGSHLTWARAVCRVAGTSWGSSYCLGSAR